MKKTCFLISIVIGLSNYSFAQKLTPISPISDFYCDENPDINPYGLGPLQPEWFYQPYKIFTACPQIFVGLGEEYPRYLLDAHKGTGRFNKVKSVTIEAGTFTDYGAFPTAYPGHSIINAYGQGSLFEVGKVIANNSSSAKKIFAVTADAGVRIYSNSGAPFIVFSSSNNKILQVDNNGTLHARQIEVDLNNWPDYVFKKGYKLMSLEELAAYIVKHKHLPNIPAAVEIENGSLNLGNMQKLLMEKIEELTIYTIKQNEQIKSLQKHNQQLQTELDELKNEVAEIKAMLNQK